MVITCSYPGVTTIPPGGTTVLMRDPLETVNHGRKCVIVLGFKDNFSFFPWSSLSLYFCSYLARILMGAVPDLNPDHAT